MSSFGSYLRIAAALAGTIVLPDERPRAGGRCVVEDGPAAGGSRVLTPVGGGVLASRYRLPVTDVPEPPPFEARPQARLRTVCPVEVRAIVIGEHPADSFAVVAAGPDSRIVHAGEGLRAGGSLLSVAAIEAGAVVLRQDTELLRCGFQR